MATESNLQKVHVFPSMDSYNQNKTNIGADDIALIPDESGGAIPKGKLFTLTASGWNASTKKQTISVSGILADESKQLIQPVPAAASQAAYIEAGILLTGQAANSLTFTAETVPTVNLSVYIVWQEVLAG